MPWYRAGTVTVTNGSAVVTGAGTDFVANTQAGEVFLGADGRVYEISSVPSATELRIVPNYQGATAGGQAYGIQPTQSFARDLAIAVAALIASFAAVRDGVGQGLFPDGSPASPGFRFANDQNTGFRRAGEDAFSAVTGGADRFIFGTINNSYADIAFNQLASSISFGAERYNLGGFSVAAYGLTVGVNDNPTYGPSTVMSGYGGLRFGTLNAERMRLDHNGSLLVGTKSGPCHVIQRDEATFGSDILRLVQGGGNIVGAFYAVDQDGATAANGANAALKLGRSTTGRSLAATGTGNFTGSDYAEYMAKADGCGAIAKGDVCGVDRNGRLTRIWADAVRYVVKSTDPSLVGGDSWASHLSVKPDEPAAEPSAPTAPGPMPSGDDEAAEQARAAWREEVNRYPALRAAYDAAHEAWEAAVSAYKIALPAWQAELEKARVCVDRIAFCGQVPVNVDADTLAACEAALGDGVAVYLVAIARGAGIGVTAVRENDITLPQYMRRVGCVWAIRDGRPWVDVQHG